MSLFQHKKGTDKPIEIFVALFIILAVAMVILQMFSKQISGKTKELKQIEQDTKLKQDLQRAQQMCAEKCTNALENDCTDMMRAQFCITYIHDSHVDGLDLDGNGVLTNYNTVLAGGIGVCEDRVYCPQLIDCTCKQQLTMAQCQSLLCKYWSKQGIPDPSSTLGQYFSPGECYTGQQTHWYTTLGGAGDANGVTTALTCLPVNP